MKKAMKRYLLIQLGILLLLAFQAEGREVLRFTGTVVDSSYSPVKGSQIYLFKNNQLQDSTVSNGAGKYQFVRRPDTAGSYTLMLLDCNEDTVEVTGSYSRQDFVINNDFVICSVVSSSPSASNNDTLTFTGNVVQDTTGTPALQGIDVQLYINSNHTATATSDSNGAYSFQVVVSRPGKYALKVTDCQGNIVEAKGGISKQDQVIENDLAICWPPEKLTFRGTVYRNTAGNPPIAGQMLYLYKNDTLRDSTNTGSSGGYSFQRNVDTAGTYRIVTLNCHNDTVDAQGTYTTQDVVISNDFAICWPPVAPNTIEGVVTRMNGLHLTHSAIVYLLGFDTLNQAFMPVDSQSTLDSFSFPNPGSGIFKLKAQMQSGPPQFRQLLPTYYHDALHWFDADSITVNADSGYFAFIDLIHHRDTLNTGQGKIRGRVSHNPGKRGESVKGVQILLLNADQEPVNHTFTDNQGEYFFGDLPKGTFYVMAEVINLTSEKIRVDLKDDETEIENVNMRITREGVVATSIAGIRSVDPGFSLYPNPVRDEFYVEMNLTTHQNVVFEIVDLHGRVMVSEEYLLAPGRQQVDISAADLSAGLYFLRIAGDDFIETKKFAREK
jgi:hypothetical protein